MAKRITQLDELTQAAQADLVPIVDDSTGTTKKITVANLTGNVDLGWVATGEAWAYASATTITVPTDATTKYDDGMIVRFNQSTGGTKYAVIVNVAATLLTVTMLNSATLENEAITAPVYAVNNPIGASLKPSESLLATSAFFATSTQAITNSAAYTDVITYTEDYDIGNNFDPTTGIYTCPYDGLYYFSFTGGFTNAASSSARMGCSITVVGVKSIANQYALTGASNHDPFVSVSASYIASAGDEVIAAMYQDMGTESLVAPSNFNGYLVART